MKKEERCPYCGQEVATFVTQGGSLGDTVSLTSHTSATGRRPRPFCPGSRAWRQAGETTWHNAQNGQPYVNFVYTAGTDTATSADAPLIAEETADEWRAKVMKLGARVTKDELWRNYEKLVADYDRLVMAAEGAARIRDGLRVNSKHHAERRTELIAQADASAAITREKVAELDAARARIRVLSDENSYYQDELNRAGRRQKKDKRRIKALINALAGLR
jgi:hypothetical protein